MEEHYDDEKPEINLRRFTNHQKVFPWVLVVKIILGIGLVLAAYYLSKEIIEGKANEEKGEKFEIEISTD